MTPKPFTRMSARRSAVHTHSDPLATLRLLPWWFRGVLFAAGYVVLAWVEVVLWPS